MAFKLGFPLSALDLARGCAIALIIDVFIYGVDAKPHKFHGWVSFTKRSYMVQLGIVSFLYSQFKTRVIRWWRKEEEKSVYGLQHGRLHLQAMTPMWMNMGFWKENTDVEEMTMAEACRNLLKKVLAEAGFVRETETEGVRQRRCLIDLGFGCGDQTVYLISNEPVRACDKEWWDEREHCARFDDYIGITKDAVQARYASERVEELKRSRKTALHDEEQKPNISLFCADAANPKSWNEQIQTTIKTARDNSTERWVLALDTAYHFSPTRWPLLSYIHSDLNASFMAFDLCLSPTPTFTQTMIVSILAAIMGAPYKNFTTPQQYRRKLMQAGYRSEDISITDISEHVFTPLAVYLGEQDKKLKVLGLGIGSFNVAKKMFGWWGRSGAVRGVVVVARR
jgi:hypothetical protein